MIDLKAKVHLTHAGEFIKPGDTFKISIESALVLVNAGDSEPVDEDAFKIAVDVFEGKVVTLPGTGDGGVLKEPTEEEKAAAELKAAEEEKARLVKAIDSKYKRDLLADAAKLAGVDFAVDAKKSAIVDAVIAQGKAEILLKNE